MAPEKENPECRFVSSMNWDETLKALDKGLPSSQIRSHREVNIPAAKYRHIESTNTKTAWEGINVYQLGGDPSAEIRIFVIPRPAEPVTDKPSKKKEGKKKKDKGK
ncbi:MAG: hypothetical protein HY904_00490 [Deltaproteobacteria bacterium]|nr:hypothetical protein [Deltaproteobacteria bacterium]